MAKEAREVPAVVAQQLEKNEGAMQELVASLKQLNPRLIYITQGYLENTYLKPK
jgi:glucosamine--fructose-6-phosphate aminotransferase (isomerizing)